MLARADWIRASDVPYWRLGWQRPQMSEGLEWARCLAQCWQEIAEWAGATDADLPADVAADLTFCRTLVSGDNASTP